MKEYTIAEIEQLLREEACRRLFNKIAQMSDEEFVDYLLNNPRILDL